MLSLNDILIGLGGALAVIVALHAYAHWSIRNIDRSKERANREDTSLGRSDLTARSGELSTIPVRVQDVPPRHR
jgi:hypothetical protein